MHPLRVLLYVSLVIAIAVAWGFGAALHHAGVATPSASVIAVLSFLAFMVPWVGVFLWAVRRGGDLEELTDRTRLVAEGGYERPIADRTYHGEVDDLARAVDELRATIVRHAAESREHKAAMEEIVASLGEGLIGVGPTGRVVVANARVAEMFGSGTNVAGRSIIEVVRKQSVVAAVDKALRGETSVVRITVGAGEGQRQIEIRVFPVEASPGIAAVALFIDVTTLERLQRIRKDFLDDFSHEVRTPLAGLRSAAETLEGGGLSPQEEQQLRSVMQRQIARIERLVSDLAELNQIESGEIELQRRPVSLRTILSELSEDYKDVALQGEDVVVAIDSARAQQIFTNLLDNAVRHGGGAVTIDVHSENGDAVVRVSDQGPGIPPAELERVFHRFYRVDRSRSQPGTGLGLAIAKHLVAAHGGSIRAYNRAGGGATFEVRLPAAP